MRKLLLLSLLAAKLATTAFAHGDDDAPPALTRTALIHGTAGPFAVAGYRMGESALRTLKVKRGDMSLDVTHYAPAEVQWSCIVDGLQAATGTSLGKLNLHLTPASKAEMRSVVKNRKTGETVELKLAPEFIESHMNLPPAKLPLAGEKVLKIAPAKLFTTRSVK